MSKSKVFDTTLEILFCFENKLEKQFEGIYFHTHSSLQSDNGLYKPYYIVLSSNNEPTRMKQSDILETLGYIPYMKVPRNSYKFFMIDMNNKITLIKESDKKFDVLQGAYLESINDNTISEDKTLSDIESFLTNIEHTSKNNIITLYPKSPEKIIISSNDTSSRNVITPLPRSFLNCKSLGYFTRFHGKDITHATESHIACIDKCYMCDSIIVIDWFSPNKNICPLCGEHDI